MIQVETTPYGADAHRALAAEIARLKGGDPLRPVSVVVSSLGSTELQAVRNAQAAHSADVPFDTVFCMSAAKVIFERQMLLDQIVKTIESEIGLQAVHNDKLQRCELVNKSKEAE